MLTYKRFEIDVFQHIETYKKSSTVNIHVTEIVLIVSMQLSLLSQRKCTSTCMVIVHCVLEISDNTSRYHYNGKHK